ncbi:MAG: cytochrome C [Nitrospirota bacterium]
MKRLFVLAAIILAAAITTAQAGSLVTLLAQAAAEAPPAAPAAVPEARSGEAAPAAPVAKPAETAPAAAEPKPVPVAKPAAPDAPKTAAPRSAPKQDHNAFADMSLKECGSCHKGEGIALNHDADWVRGHRLLSVRPDKNCVSCHQQSFCLDCHKGGGIDVNLKTNIVGAGTSPGSHRTDFREIHPLKALDNPQSCYRCHAAKYCSDCHAKFRGEDLKVLSHRKGWSNLQTANPGPAHSTFTTAQCQTCHPGGLLPTHTWSSDHGREARRNLQACQSCHSDGQICQTCHSARTGLRINPHPRNWDKVKESYKKKSNGRSCAKCHDNY